ncbi:hypothetical protein PHYPSEUDO_010158 [Phytophthora pseudosyringae]|uniref:Uncharacterized protein n=1 Tax=Phytophthora pseudosyringae TaxID=221518 RepID=A0A8T1VAP0_9STRA|nr:hypothetical protein PHYPSEUDO_010158 [Phytophthora pseudosyringae]
MHSQTEAFALRAARGVLAERHDALPDLNFKPGLHGMYRDYGTKSPSPAASLFEHSRAIELAMRVYHRPADHATDHIMGTGGAASAVARVLRRLLVEARFADGGAMHKIRSLATWTEECPSLVAACRRAPGERARQSSPPRGFLGGSPGSSRKIHTGLFECCR